MEEITEEKCIELIKKKFPRFLPYWESYVKEHGSDDGITIQMMPFEEYTIDTLKINDTSELKKIFDFVELLLNKGSQSVQNAIATGFLEYLMSLNPDKINFRRFVTFLGEHALCYCKAWDKFTGCRTNGLWDK